MRVGKLPELAQTEKIIVRKIAFRKSGNIPVQVATGHIVVPSIFHLVYDSSFSTPLSGFFKGTKRPPVDPLAFVLSLTF
jgi:hypothetical protein